ncbi:hypothetical protein PM082_005910 [Marasmius tenuissimus]|nr:hypothetical protein PM082_005910 [Marasmius tenuissimus]
MPQPLSQDQFKGEMNAQREYQKGVEKVNSLNWSTASTDEREVVNLTRRLYCPTFSIQLPKQVRIVRSMEKGIMERLPMLSESKRAGAAFSPEVPFNSLIPVSPSYT